MCGRFTLTTSRKQVAEQFPLFEVPDLEPRFNIAPTQPVAAARVLAEPERREVVLLRWGLIPSWADDPAIGNRLLNARAETVADKPSFRSAYRKRRCLIPADGFYEWQKLGKQKQPYFIHLRDGALFAFAGLWEHWERDGQPVESCTILTTTANELVRPLHERMPVIIEPRDYPRWLDPGNQTAAGLDVLLRPYPAEAMGLYAVSTHVNNPRHEDAECLKPLAS
jgi:putative SOS response-associated peptidase YedK